MTISLSDAFLMGQRQVYSVSTSSMSTQTSFVQHTPLVRTIATQTKRVRKTPFVFTPLPTVHSKDESPTMDLPTINDQESEEEKIIKKEKAKPKKPKTPKKKKELPPAPPLDVVSMSVDDLKKIVDTSDDIDHIVQARTEMDKREKEFTSAVVMETWTHRDPINTQIIPDHPVIDVMMTITMNNVSHRVPVITINKAVSRHVSFAAIKSNVDINKIPQEERALVMATLALSKVNGIDEDPEVVATIAHYLERLGYLKNASFSKLKDEELISMFRDKLFVLVAKVHFANFWCSMVTARCEASLALSAFVDIIPNIDEPLLLQNGFKGFSMLQTVQLIATMFMVNGACEAIRMYKELGIREKLKGTAHPELQVTLFRLAQVVKGFSASLDSRLYLVSLFPSFADIFEQFTFASPPSLTFLLSTDYFKDLVLTRIMTLQRTGKFDKFDAKRPSALEFRFMPILMEVPDVTENIYTGKPYECKDPITFHSFVVLTEANVYRVIVSLMDPDQDHKDGPASDAKDVPMVLAWAFVKGLNRSQRSVSVKELEGFIRFMMIARGTVGYSEVTIKLLSTALQFYRSS